MRASPAKGLGLAAGLLVMGAAAEPARISVDSPGMTEGDGPGVLDFTVTRTGETGGAVTLEYRTDDGSAVAPGDYTAIPLSRLTLASGETFAVVPVAIHGDTDNEGDETLFLHLTGIVSVRDAPACYAAGGLYATGTAPSALTALDVNGDGRPDLAVTNRGSNTVSVRLNLTAPGAATTTYSAAQDFDTGSGPASVVATDIDGDGRPDLVVANANADTTGVSVLLNTTAAGATLPDYTAARAFATGSGSASVTATDVDRDGRPDLAVTQPGSDSVTVLLNATEAGAEVPAFAAAGTFAAGAGPRAAVAADFDGDGRPDLAVANEGGDSVSVLINATAAGDAVAAYAAAVSFATGSRPRAIVALDLNGDGRADLITANAGGASVSVLLNTTTPGADTPAFTAPSDFAAGNEPASIAAVDADDDGRADLAVANAGSDDVSVLLNTTAVNADTPVFTAASGFGVGDGPRALATADFDGDGLGDLATANTGDDSLSVLLNRQALIEVSEGIGTLHDDDTRATPDAFSFEDQRGVALNRPITSNEVTITGITVSVPVTVTGGTYSIGCTNKFTSGDSTIGNGETVCVRHTSSRDFGTETRTVLTVGGVSGTFTSTTLGASAAPDPFSFTDVSGVLLNSIQVSNSITLSGINVAVAIGVTGGEYSLGCDGTFTAAPGSAAPGTTVCVRHTSSAQHGVATHTTLTAGGVSDTFTSTTPGEQDFSKTGAPGPLDALFGLLAALARRRAPQKNPSARLPWRTDSP